MDLNERMKKFERKLRAKEAELEQRTQRDLDALEKRLDDKLSQTAGSERASATAGRARVSPLGGLKPRSFRIDMSRERALYALDEIMDRDFELARFLGGSMNAYPTTYCETAGEYLEPIIADIPMSDERRKQLLQEAEAAAEQGSLIPILMSLGVHIPGAGCFINGWYMARDTGLSPADYFRAPEGFARIVTTASHEKWGHGFITEMTALGREKRSVQLDMHHIADQFETRTVDTPDHARLREQWAILFHASNYVEEGFATWVERYLAERMAEEDPACADFLRAAPHFTLDGILSRLASAEGSGAAEGNAAAETAGAIQGLFYQQEVSLQSVHAALAGAVQAIDAMGDAFPRAVGMPGPYALGYCLVDAIAQRQGPKCVPYAVATACNIEYGLDTIGNHDLANYVAGHPDLNVNTRLASMMFVREGQRDDVEGFLVRVRDEVGLAPPVG